MKKLFIFFFVCFVFIAQAQQKVIQLYNGAAPGSESWNWKEAVSDSNQFRTKLVYNVTSPSITVFTPDASVANGTAIVICPGGGFHMLSITSEGTEVANWLVKKGITCFVLKYRLIHVLGNDPVTEFLKKLGQPEFEEQSKMVIPMAVADGRAAIAYVRAHAAEYNISPNKIGIIGFSAGGTVTASTSYGYAANNRPDFVAPIYAFMPAELQGAIPPDAPPIFLCAASDDQFQLVPHSIDLYNKWIASKHQAELHIYTKGGHGFGMRKQNLPSDQWIERFADWLDVQGFMKAYRQ